MKTAISFIVLAAAAWSQDAWSPDLSMRVQPVGTVTPSPDGELVAYTQSRALMARADGSWRVQLTHGEKSAAPPSFSPDGVYFSSERSGKPSLWRSPVDGGGAEMRVVDENPKKHGLWIIPAEPDSSGKRPARKLGDIKSPDARLIAFSHTPTPGADDWTNADISEVTVEAGEVRPLAATGAAAHWAGLERIVVLRDSQAHGTQDGGDTVEFSTSAGERYFLESV